MPKTRKPSHLPPRTSQSHQAQRRQQRRKLRDFMRYDSEYEPVGPCRCLRCRRGESNPNDGQPNVGAVVEVVAGPFKGQLGYVDDETNVGLEEEADAYVLECSEEDLTTQDDQVPWSVGPQWAVVYLQGLLSDHPEDLSGYNLIPFPHLHRIADEGKRRVLLDAMTGTSTSEA